MQKMMVINWPNANAAVNRLRITFAFFNDGIAPQSSQWQTI